MLPTLFTLGRFAVPSYTVLLDLGLILGLVLAYFEGKRALGSGELTLDAGLWVIVGGILGGRLGFVLANGPVFIESPMRALRVWEGGLAFHGAFLGGLLAFGLAAYLQSRHREEGYWLWTLRLADIVTPSLALGLAFGWLGCLLYGSAYGAIGSGFGTAILPDVTGVEAPRYATQVLGTAVAVVLLVIFWLLRKRWPFPGSAFLMFNLLYFAGQFFIEYFRGDETLYLEGWRLPQLLDLALALLAGAGLLALWWRNRNSPLLADTLAEDEPEPEPEGEEIEVVPEGAEG